MSRGGRAGQADLVDHGLLGAGLVGGRVAVGGQRGQARGPLQQSRGLHRARRPEPLEGQVGPVDDLAHPHEPGHRGQALGLQRLLLEAAVHRGEQPRRLGRAEGDQLPGHVAPVDQAGGDRVHGVAPPVGGEVRAGRLPHPARPGPVQVGGRLQPVHRQVLGAAQVLLDHAHLPHGRVVEHHGQQHPGADRRAQPGHPPGQGVDAGRGQHRHRQRHQRKGSGGGPQGQAGVAAGERLEQGPGRRRAVPGMGAHPDQGADGQQEQEVAAVAPAQGRAQRQGPHHQPEADEHQPEALGVVHAGLDPGPELVVAVEEPVAEPTQDLGGGAGVGHRLVALGVAGDGQAVGPLDGQPGHPPQRHPGGERPDAGGDGPGPPPGDAALNPRGVGQPQRRGQPGQRQAGGVDASDGDRGQSEQGRVAPSAGPGGPHGEPDQPAQAGPGGQDYRDPGRVVQQIGAELIAQDRDQQPPALPAQGAQQIQHPEAGRGQQRPQPQPLSQPVGQAQVLGQPVEGPHRPQVADVLVGDGAQGPVGVPQGGGAGQQAARVQVQVGLGVGADPARAGGHHRPVGGGNDGQHRPPVRPPPRPRPVRPSAGPPGHGGGSEVIAVGGGTLRPARPGCRGRFAPRCSRPIAPGRPRSGAGGARGR